MTPVVSARGIGYRYPSGRVGVEPLDFRVDPGEVVLLLGPNGSGKSTLLRLLAGDLGPQGGTLALMGVSGPPFPPGTRRRIAYAPDRPVHFEPLTGLENVAFFRRLRVGASRPPAEGRPSDPEAPRGLLEAFGLGEAAGVAVSDYSFGMCRRLLLAETLAAGGDLYLLDEPTVGLDPEGVRALGEVVARRAEEGAAVVRAGNEVHRSPEWATRILFLHRGRVISDSPAADLLQLLGGRTRIEVEFRGGLDGFTPPDGLSELVLRAGHLRCESRSGGTLLPRLMAALHAAGAEVRGVHVREPDLGDLFQSFTGEELDPRTADRPDQP